MARRSFWGWGTEDGGPNEEQAAGIARTLAERFGESALELAPAPRLEDVTLPEPRVAAPSTLAGIVSTTDLLRGIVGLYASPKSSS